METTELTQKQILGAQALIAAAKYKREHKREFPPQWYDWQIRGFNSLKPEIMTLAGNQTGKTWSATYHDALDATGKYPDDWKGYRFEHPTDGMVIGVDSEQLLVLQNNLFGEVVDKKFTGGWIHPSEIDHRNIQWSNNGIAKRVAVFSKYGRSTIHLRSYTQSKTGQGTLSFAGYIFDWVHCDEQMPDSMVGQIKVRLVNGARGKGGRLRYTMTPELGMTAEVAQFMETPADFQELIGPVAMDECSHITPENRERILAGVPEHERDMRAKGIPFFGSGLIYSVPDERIRCEGFKIPEWYRCLKGIDLGHTHATAICRLAWNPESDILYLVSTYSSKGENAATHAQAINNMWPSVPTVFPHDVDQTERGSGKTVRQWYRDAGVHRTVDFQNPDGSRYVEPGILNLQERMRDGRFYAFSEGNDEFWREKRMYHRNDGKIVKEHDDVMDALRYAAQMIEKRGVTREQYKRAPQTMTLAKQRRGKQRGLN